MAFNKIKGNTYYIPGATNVGVYVFKNKNCLLVDSGINNTTARKIESILNENNLHVKYIINTHSHIDHCGGNYYLKAEYPGLIAYASEKERLYMENPELFSNMLFSVPSSFKQLDRLQKPLTVDFSLEYGTNKINDEKFEVIDTKGHAAGQIAIVTPEKVCFLGDCIFSEEILKKYKLPYLVQLKESIDTLNRLREIDADYFVISHINKILEKEELINLIDLNLKTIDKFKEQVVELLAQPQSKESLTESIIVLNDMTPDFSEYFLDYAAVSAYISYLNESGVIDYTVSDGKVYYFIKS